MCIPLLIVPADLIRAGQHLKIELLDPIIMGPAIQRAC